MQRELLAWSRSQSQGQEEHTEHIMSNEEGVDAGSMKTPLHRMTGGKESS